MEDFTKKAISYLNGLIKPSTPKSELDLIEYCKRCVRGAQTAKKAENEYLPFIDELYAKFYNAYRRKGSKEQGRKTWQKKLKGLNSVAEITEKAQKIVEAYNVSVRRWNDEERDLRYIPLVSSWLNANIPD